MLKKSIKVFFSAAKWVVIIILILVLFLFIGLNIPATQGYIGEKTATFLVQKTGKDIRIGHIGLNLWAELTIKDVYIPDNNDDTLADLDYVAIDIHLWDLFHNKIHLEKVSLERLTFNLHKNASDSLYNYNYIIEAFSGSSPESEADTTQADSFEFLIDEVLIEQVKAHYSDAVSGLYMTGDLNYFEAEAETFDLDKQIIALDEVMLKKANWTIKQLKSSTEDTATSQPTNWLISANELIVEKTEGHFINKPDGIYLDPNIEYLQATQVKADISKMDFSLEKLALIGNEVKYYLGISNSDSTQRSIEDSTTSETPWHLFAKSIELKDNYLVYYDSTKTLLPENQFDAAHLEAKHLSLQLNALDISPTQFDAHLQNFAFHLSEQMAVNTFSGQFHLDSTHLNLTDQHLETKHTQLDYSLKSTFSNITEILNSPDKTLINALKIIGEIDVRDLNYFYPVDELPASIQKIAINTELKGQLNDLTLSRFKIESENQLKVDISGEIAGLPELDSLSYDLVINKLMTNLPAIREVAQKQIPATIELPTWIDLSGTAKGSNKLVAAQLEMNSQLGLAKASINVDLEKDNERFDLDMSAKELALGKLIGEDTLLGTTTFSFKAKGRYLDPNKMDAEGILELKKLELGKHTLTDGNISAIWKNKQLVSSIDIHEKYLDFVIKTVGHWENESLSTSNDIAINNIDIKELNFSEESIQLKTTLNLSTEGISLDDFWAKITIEDGSIIHESGYYSFAPSIMDVLLKTESASFAFESPIVNIDFESSFNIQAMPEVMKYQFSHYFDMTDSVKIDEHDNKEFTFSCEIINERVFEEVLIPGLKEIEVNSITGSYTSSTHNLQVEADILHLIYEDIIVDSLSIQMSSNIKTLIAELNVSQLSAAGYTFFYPHITAQASDNELNISIQLANEEKKQKFGLEGVLKKVAQGYSWHVHENGLMLYNEFWEVSPGNEVVYKNDKSLEFNDFKISKGRQSVTAKKLEESGIKIDFDNFTIENISAIVFSEEQLICGLLNGSLEIDVLPNKLGLSADIAITDFAYVDDTLGNIDLKVKNAEDGVYQSVFKVSGNNQINGNVSYKINTDDIDGQINLTKLDLATLESYSDGALKDLSGIAEGNVKINGKLKEPNFKGQISLNNASFHLNAVNLSYEIEESKLSFSQNEIQLETLQVQDKEGNKASVNGFVSLENFLPKKLNINISTNTFPILNTGQTKDELFYGNVAMTSEITIRGTYDLPEVEAKLSISPGSNFTILVPENEVKIEAYKDVVEFVDFSDPEKPIEKQVIETSKSEILGIKLNAQIEINPDVKLRMIIDPIAGDYLEIGGSAYLTYDLGVDGQMKLTGVYTVKKGHYQMTYYNIIKRKFSIQEGSTVNWSGDPYNARVNINAIYSTKASLLPLVQSQISQNQVDNFRKSVPVDVVLNISDEMLSPKLDFNIVLPTYSSAGFSGIVQAKLDRLRESESEMNKQVFSLLILNRFIPEDPNQNSASGSLGNSARGSVSELVSDQFDALAGKYIKAVNIDFNFDSYTDYSGGQAQGRTDLEVELSKAIFNDRLIVSVGSDFNVEGGNNQQGQENVNGFVGDFKAEYLLSENGKYRAKVYRENEYAGVIDGNLTKTGFSFILTEEFKRLFKREEDKQVELKGENKDGEK